MAYHISPEVRAKIAAAWPDMLDRLARGDLVRDIVRDVGVLRQQVDGYKLTTPGAVAEWDTARESSADALWDEAMDNARANVDRNLAQHVRTRIDTLKWAARIRNPRLYGDKAQLDVNVKSVDLTKIIQDANARLAAAKQGRIIDVTPSNSGADHADTRAMLGLEAAIAKAADLY